MSPRTHTSEIRVRYAETDQMGVAYHVNYLIWCEVGRTDYIRALGTSYAQLEQDGIALAVTEASLRFNAPARYDDIVLVTTTLTAVKSRSLTFDYRLTRAHTGERLASARTVLVSIDRNGRVASLPEAVHARLSCAMDVAG
jgi:acyl-CoA thioester hydrolase